jgi:hypothetical protein
MEREKFTIQSQLLRFIRGSKWTEHETIYKDQRRLARIGEKL